MRTRYRRAHRLLECAFTFAFLPYFLTLVRPSLCLYACDFSSFGSIGSLWREFHLTVEACASLSDYVVQLQSPRKTISRVAADLSSDSQKAQGNDGRRTSLPNGAAPRAEHGHQAKFPLDIIASAARRPSADLSFITSSPRPKSQPVSPAPAPFASRAIAFPPFANFLTALAMKASKGSAARRSLKYAPDTAGARIVCVMSHCRAHCRASALPDRFRLSPRCYNSRGHF